MGLYQPKYRDARGVIRKSPTWWARYGARGKLHRESTQTADYQEAKRFLKERELAVAREEPIRDKVNRVTFTEMAAALRRDYELNGRHRATLSSRLLHLEAFFGGQRMAKILPNDLERYKDIRRQAEATNGTINRELEVLSRAFTLGRDLGLLTVGLRVRTHRLAEAAPRAGFFEDAQYHAVARHLAPDLQVAIAMAQELGWRTQSEVLTLERSQVDRAEGTLRLEPGMAKNDAARTIYLSPALTVLIDEQLARVEALQRQMGTIIPFVFPHLRGRLRGQRIQDFKRTWKTACRKAGVPGMLRHDFRRTAVRNMVNRGIAEKVAMTITGHKTRSVFDRYHIVSPADLKAAAAKMGQPVAPDHFAGHRDHRAAI
jgi:integrase